MMLSTRSSQQLAGLAMLLLITLIPVACGQGTSTPVTDASESVTTSLDNTGPALALIYNGEVAAEGGPEALATVAQSLGMEVAYFDSAEQLPSLLEDASFCMIGGTEDDLSPLLEEFTPQVRQVLSDWLSSGGAYLGICGGGYVASSGWEEVNGFVDALGIVSVDTEAWVEEDAPLIITVVWNGTERPIYYQYGPAFLVANESGIEILARYDDGQVAALAAGFGEGRVVVCGPHPEAVESWLDDDPAPASADSWEPTEDLAAALFRELAE